MRSDPAARSRSVRLAAIATAGGLVLAGVGIAWAVTSLSQPSSPSTLAEPTTPSATPSTTPVGATSEGSGEHFSERGRYSEQATMSLVQGAPDYNPVSSNWELQAMSDLVVSGEIVEVNEGRRVVHYAGGDRVYDPTEVVIILTDVEVAFGALEPDSDGFVYITTGLITFGRMTGSLSDFELGFPPGMKVVAYLSQVPPDRGRFRAGVDGGIVDPDAEHPSSQPLYKPLGPQGFAVQYPGTANVLWPGGAGIQAGEIRDALPGGPLLGGLGDY